ncbi:MAG: hypothetical protein A3J30_03275 [Candidatus Wildermuthbacteria bacterium RIFCSPLOWO2_02_FULL_47_9c]|nr:MAG: hypothetical protein UY38_C0001G0065 [Parcubacteria group bacterium GW2011_GWB1_49_12]KKW09244.1 MAG: hypothetical protein UY45_C0001G0130 [Parcubacteria group bacterium GW2011_GWA1_49_26]OHA61494.1 MAG: hypothetical protein A2109_01280 [Candidatus Wildermuthbacteria bacterium GWA1_49_26]OHA66163.1 MAG: hypothetical protein A2674_01755 [Candidatus Wildermuthbacteria bacterium RIFCSPHIGHO2_01_FULL_50_47]OHA69763.1 MAG: hypothetical protein A3D63_00775 [Candidatus Wildermuthbacteria bacte
MAEELIIRTKKEREVLDITQQVQALLVENSFRKGVCHLFLLHTSAAIATADLDEGTDLDMLDAFELVVPALKYRHKHNPEHVKYHILVSLIGPSLTVPVENGELVLGAWQKIVLIEFGGPRERNIVVSFSAVVE